MNDLMDSYQRERTPVLATGAGRVRAASLGNPVFRSRFGLRCAYASGAMYRGIASCELVARMAKAGFLGFFGAGGLSIDELGRAIDHFDRALSQREPFGMNLLANYMEPTQERNVVRLYLERRVRNVEAAAFTQMTPALVHFRVSGLRKDGSGKIVCDHRIVAKVSRPEVAEAFMSPPPRHLVETLVRESVLTLEQAALSLEVPMSYDICVEADSGGHTDGGIATVLLPTMLRLRDALTAKHGYVEPICVGLAGGIGTPEAAAAAFVLGADFILTGSINQCTAESGMSADAKELLQDMNVQDTEYAPAGDMFETGAKVQVLKKGVFFSARANKLHALYSNYSALEEIPEKTQRQIQDTYFKKSFGQVWEDTKRYLEKRGLSDQIRKAEANPKTKMALVFRWYFGHSTKVALDGRRDERVNYQVHTGPALGAFNQWVKGTALESYTNRHADEIGVKIMNEAAEYLERRFSIARGETT